MAAAWIDNPTTKKSARTFRKKLSTQGALAGVDPDAGDIAKSATMILIKDNLPGKLCLAPRSWLPPCQPTEWLFRLSSFPASAKRVTSAVQSP
jgi:hypothetical protein